MEARYRLEPMREARTRDERARRADLAGAVGDAQRLAADLAAIAGRTERARTAIEAARTARDAALAGRALAAVIAYHDRYLRRLRRELEAAIGEQLRAEARHRGQLDAVDDARQQLTLAHAQREVIERHFAAWRTERRKLAERRED
jgi:hypothetical protein